MLTAILRWMILVAAVSASSCNTSQHSRIGRPTVAIAVSTNLGRQPSNEQVAWIHNAMKPELLQAGFSLAEDARQANFVVTVNFTAAPDSDGGRVTVTSIQPSARFREATDGGDTPEAKEWRRRQREYEQWVERQARSESE